MKRSATIAALASCLLVVAGVSYVLGYRAGWREGLLSDAIPRGVLAMGQLRALEAGKLENTQLLLQGQVDFGLIAANELLEGPGFTRLDAMAGLSIEAQQMDYIQRLAKFRSETPTPLKYSEFSSATSQERPADPELVQQVRTSEIVLRTMVQRFGQ